MVNLRTLGDALLDFSRTWELEGDLIRCRHCRRGCLPTYALLPFPHATSCPSNLDDDVDQLPWVLLASTLSLIIDIAKHGDGQ